LSRYAPLSSRLSLSRKISYLTDVGTGQESSQVLPYNRLTNYSLSYASPCLSYIALNWATPYPTWAIVRPHPYLSCASPLYELRCIRTWATPRPLSKLRRTLSELRRDPVRAGPRPDLCYLPGIQNVKTNPNTNNIPVLHFQVRHNHPCNLLEGKSFSKMTPM
jgi:hypothetical protein